MGTGTKIIALAPDAITPAAPDPTVATSMENHAAATKQAQATARAAKRPTPAKAVKKATAAESKPAARAAVSRQVANPAEVAKYFASTGLNRKELAAILGVSTSLIATVARESGDRWGAERFARARVQIDAAVTAAAKRSK